MTSQDHRGHRKMFSVEKSMMNVNLETSLSKKDDDVVVAQTTLEKDDHQVEILQKEINRLSGEVGDLKDIIVSMRDEMLMLMQEKREYDAVSQAHTSVVVEDIPDDGAAAVDHSPAMENTDGSFVIDAEHEKDLRIELGQMIRVIAKAKRELSQIKHPGHAEDEDQITRASSELDEIVSATEAATNQILESAEGIEESLLDLASIAMSLHDDNLVACGDRIGQRVTSIIEACNFQDITGQRIAKVVRTMAFIEDRVRAMIDIWGTDAFSELPLPQLVDETNPEAHLLEGPQLSNQGITQDEIDDLFN